MPPAADGGAGSAGAALALSSTTGAFGNVAVGATKELVFTLSNGGTQAAAGIAKAITGPGFSLPAATGTECGTTLNGSDASCGIRVRFTPSGLAGPVTGTLTVTATTGTAPSPVMLSANAYGILAIPFAADTRSATLGGMDGAGAALVGTMQNAADAFGFYWAIGTSTITTIPPVPGDTASGGARAISSNGLVVTGITGTGKVWTWAPGSTTSRDLGFPVGSPPSRSASPNGIDNTGAVIVGGMFDDQARLHQGLVWRSASGGGFEFLGDLVTQDVTAVGVSDNGRIVGTQTLVSSGGLAGMIWTSSGNMTQRPGTILPGNTTGANAISGDGTVIVGADANNAAVKWTTPFTAQPQLLPNVSIATGSVALGVSQTGTTIVGASATQLGTELATAWTPAAVDIAAALSGAPNIASFSLDSAKSVSADGKIIAGDGSFNGVREPWVARLP